jgi:Flp pilus assembly protein TadD
MAQAAKFYFAGNGTSALQHLERAATLAPDDPEQHLQLAGRFEALGQQQKAASQMEQMVRLRPEAQTAANFANLIEYCLDHGQAEKARHLLKNDLVARWPQSFETAYMCGVMTLTEGKSAEDVAQAIEFFERGESLKPDDLRLKIQLGIAYGRLGKFDKAEPLLRAAVAREPRNRVALFHLGETLRTQGQAQEAEKHLKEHQRLSDLAGRQRYLEVQYVTGKYAPEGLLELAGIYEQFSKFKRAGTTLRLYTRLKPADPAGHEPLARIAEKLEDNETARVERELAEALKKGSQH